MSYNQPEYNQPEYNHQTHPPCEECLQHGPYQHPSGPEYSPPMQAPENYNGYNAPYASQEQYQQYQQPQSMGENASYYGNATPPPNQQRDPNDPENEKGLGSTVVGGAAGGYLGHQMGGKMSTLGGAALGAVGMNMFSHYQKQQHAQNVQNVPYATAGMPVASTGIPPGFALVPAEIPKKGCCLHRLRMKRRQKMGLY